MADAYTDLLIRIFPIAEGGDVYPVEAELDDGSRFTGGQLKLDHQTLLNLELDSSAYGLALFEALFPPGGDLRPAQWLCHRPAEDRRPMVTGMAFPMSPTIAPAKPIPARKIRIATASAMYVIARSPCALVSFRSAG